MLQLLLLLLVVMLVKLLLIQERYVEGSDQAFPQFVVLLLDGGLTQLHVGQFGHELELLRLEGGAREHLPLKDVLSLAQDVLLVVQNLFEFRNFVALGLKLI